MTVHDLLLVLFAPIYFFDIIYVKLLFISGKSCFWALIHFQGLKEPIF